MRQFDLVNACVLGGQTDLGRMSALLLSGFMNMGNNVFLSLQMEIATLDSQNSCDSKWDSVCKMVSIVPSIQKIKTNILSTLSPPLHTINWIFLLKLDFNNKYNDCIAKRSLGEVP
jgi:hypothetical protein